MKRSKLELIYRNKVKILFILSLISLGVSLLGGIIFGFTTEYTSALSIDWKYFSFLGPEPMPSFVTTLQLSGITTWCLGFMLLKEKIKKHLGKDAIKLILIVCVLVLFISVYEAWIRFSFWGPYALRNLDLNLSSPSEHTKIDELKMGGHSFVFFTKMSFMCAAIGFFTFFWFYRYL